MALARWKDLCIDAVDPRVATRFWAGVLGLAPEVGDDGDGVLRHPGSPERTIWVNRVPEGKTVKNRVHLDVTLPSYSPLIAEGAAFLEDHEVEGRHWVVLGDPEGNELCVFPVEPERDWETALVVDASEPPTRMAAWWADVLGARLAPGPDGTLRWLRDVPGFPFDVWKFVPVPEPRTVKNRWHWDVTCDDVEGLVAHGASLLRRPDGEISWHVLADPEGNEFCAFPAP